MSLPEMNLLKFFAGVIDRRLSYDIEMIFVQNSKRLKFFDVSGWPLPNKILPAPLVRIHKNLFAYTFVTFNAPNA